MAKKKKDGWKKLPKDKELEHIEAAIKVPKKKKTLTKKEDKIQEKQCIDLGPPPVKKLREKELRFIEEYVVDWNGTQAAIRAGYSKRSASEMSYDLLRKPQIAALIRQKRLEIQINTGITAENVAKELAKIAFFDVRELFECDGSVKPIENLDDNSVASIAGIEVDELYEGFGRDRERIGKVKKIKLADKVAALDKLCRHLGMYKDQLDLTFKNKAEVDLTNYTPEQAAEAYKNALKE